MSERNVKGTYRVRIREVVTFECDLEYDPEQEGVPVARAVEEAVIAGDFAPDDANYVSIDERDLLSVTDPDGKDLDINSPEWLQESTKEFDAEEEKS